MQLAKGSLLKIMMYEHILLLDAASARNGELKVDAELPFECHHVLLGPPNTLTA